MIPDITSLFTVSGVYPKFYGFPILQKAMSLNGYLDVPDSNSALIYSAFITTTPRTANLALVTLELTSLTSN